MTKAQRVLSKFDEAFLGKLRAKRHVMVAKSYKRDLDSFNKHDKDLRKQLSDKDYAGVQASKRELASRVKYHRDRAIQLHPDSAKDLEK